MEMAIMTSYCYYLRLITLQEALPGLLASRFIVSLSCLSLGGIYSRY
jgi:hypothetical protein